MSEGWANFKGDPEFSSMWIQEVEPTEEMAAEFMAIAQSMRAYLRMSKVERVVRAVTITRHGKLKRHWKHEVTDMDAMTRLRLEQEADRLEERAMIISDKFRHAK